MSDPIDTPSGFRYHNGTAEVFGDATTLRRKLTLATGNKQKQLLAAYYVRLGLEGEQLAAAELASCEAAEVLLAAVREAFNLTPFDPATGTGCTDDDVDTVLRDFQSHLAAVKKKRES